MGNELNCCKENNDYLYTLEGITTKQKHYNFGFENKESFYEKINNPLAVYKAFDVGLVNTKSIRQTEQSDDSDIENNEEKQSNNMSNINLNCHQKVSEIFASLGDDSYHKSKPNSEKDLNIENLDIEKNDKIKSDELNDSTNGKFTYYKANHHFTLGYNTRNKENLFQNNTSKILSKTINHNTTLDASDPYFFIHLSFLDVCNNVKHEYGVDISMFLKEHLVNRLKLFKKISRRYCIKHASISEEKLNSLFPKDKLLYCKGRLYSNEYFIKLSKSNNNNNKNDNKEAVYWGETDLQGKKHGYGTLIYSNGQMFEGFWLNDEFDLFGRRIDLDGTVFEGFFSKGELNGKGTESNLIFTYKGNFLNGSKNGVGELKSDMEIYNGEFENNLKHGNGRLCYLSTGNQYEGSFENNKINGQGMYKWSFGDVYSGEFKNGMLHGFGLYKWINGDSYEGDYYNGLRWGKGILINSNGNKYEGDFLDNVPHGKGKITKIGKEPIEVEFVNGMQVRNPVKKEIKENKVGEKSPSKLKSEKNQ